MPEVFVGRQPIYDRALDVLGYELLFRSAEQDGEARFDDGDRATSVVLLATFREIGPERVVGNKLAFLNLTRGFLTGEFPLPIPAEGVVLEVLEDVVPDSEVVAGVRDLSERGFRIALDDYSVRPESAVLVELADIVKVDCAALSGDDLRRELDYLGGFGVELLAEKVETYEEFEELLGLGFHYFQGFFLSRPKLVRGKRVPTNRTGLLRLLAELHDPTVEFEDLAEIVAQDVTLAYNLLRHVNSALYGLPRRVKGVHETLVILGTERVRSLASLLLLANLDDKPVDLVQTALLRGRMCELLAGARGSVSTHACFTAGLFSTLDALLEAPLSVVIAELPLNAEIAAALLHRHGPVGEILASTLAYERGDWDMALCAGIGPRALKEVFLQAVDWSDAAMASLYDRRL